MTSAVAIGATTLLALRYERSRGGISMMYGQSWRTSSDLRSFLPKQFRAAPATQPLPFPCSICWRQQSGHKLRFPYRQEAASDRAQVCRQTLMEEKIRIPASGSKIELGIIPKHANPEWQTKLAPTPSE
jgi:hypothetical protein